MPFASLLTTWRRLWRCLAAACVAASLIAAARAEEPAVPRFWEPGGRLTKPELAALPRLRFLASSDFPPFNFINGRGELAGFNVDLARALCDALGLAARCEVRALPWDELPAALARGEGEAIIAGLGVTAANRAALDFSRPYLPLPARFVARRTDAPEEPLWRALAQKPVGVVAGTAHERYLRERFPEVRAVPFADAGAMLAALEAGRLAAVFGDGMRLSFWLNDGAGARCCAFAGGPYLAPEIFGQGLSVAVRAGDAPMLAAIDYALRDVASGRRFAELYLRWFPVGFF